MLPRSMRRFVTRRLGIDALRAEQTAGRERIDALEQRLHEHVAITADLRRQLGEADALTQTRLLDVEAQLRSAATAATVAWTTLWNDIDPPRAPGRVSVVLPTRNRVELLRRAVDTVLAQRGVDFELIVVDDGSTDSTASYLQSIGDDRITVLDGGGNGAAAARNAGIERAGGSVIAFADDDNLMAPGWLATAAQHLHDDPDASGVYGAQLREPEEGGAVELLFRSPFDRVAMLGGPYIDLGATAFRAGTEGLFFDTSLTALLDWDMLIRVTATGRLDAVPVLAGLYTTSAPHRITTRDDKTEALAIVRQRASEHLARG